MMKNRIRVAFFLNLFLLPAAKVYADVAYPMYVEPGFFMRHFLSLASERGLPPAYFPLPIPEGVYSDIPLCGISEYTPNGHPNLPWNCGF
jgi:hypothetical protein